MDGFEYENMAEEEDEAPLIPCAYCTHCEERHPINIKIMTRPSDGEEITICSCPVTDEVLNADEDIEVELMSMDEIRDEDGWEMKPIDEI